MAFSHLWGSYDVEGSINYFLKNNLLTNSPSFLTPQVGATPPRTINYDFPEQPLNFPSFAITHIGSEEMPGMTFQGDRADGTFKGIARFGMSEINCWVTSKDNANWMRDLRVMRDMVFLLVQKNRYVPLYDLSTPSSPVALNAIVRWMPGRGIREMVVGQDPNPALKRKRILLTYFWTERWV